MLNYQSEVDGVLHALADPTRRQMVEQLGRGPATVSELARPLPMSLPAVVQHLQVLEASGLVRSAKVGRVRTCRLVVKRLDTVDDWIAERRRSWERRLDRLGDFLAREAAEASEAAEDDKPTPPKETP
ncbi:MAG TPA: metalloregulator ArsR/SmtB family transcription factor [Jatrophihabitans sp.]|nr:metalloregulator ArsR/SmtB family transcription factor [Jatrophihabitans sp.]